MKEKLKKDKKKNNINKQEEVKKNERNWNLKAEIKLEFKEKYK